MISVAQAEQIHNVLIEKFGGLIGIRDLAGLEAALARPYATFDQHELYPEPMDKAAAVFESLVINHPFMDGNKRISYVLMRLILLENVESRGYSANRCRPSIPTHCRKMSMCCRRSWWTCASNSSTKAQKRTSTVACCANCWKRSAAARANNSRKSN